MARTYAKLFVEVWAAGSDFRDLSSDAQRLYWLLCSQDELTSAGVLPVRVRRWSNFAPDTSIEDVESALGELIESRKVLVDNETEELLVRSFIRRDDGWRTPNIRKAVDRAIAAIESDQLRKVAAYELDRAIAEHNGEPLPEPLPEGLVEPIGNETSIEHTSPNTFHPAPDTSPADTDSSSSNLYPATGGTTTKDPRFETVIGLIVDADIAEHGTPRQANPERYRATCLNNLLRDRGPAIRQALDTRPDATAEHVARLIRAGA